MIQPSLDVSLQIALIFDMDGFRLQSGSTALHWACLNGYKEVAVLLIEAGADATVKNKVMINPFNLYVHILSITLLA